MFRDARARCAQRAAARAAIRDADYFAFDADFHCLILRYAFRACRRLRHDAAAAMLLPTAYMPCCHSIFSFMPIRYFFHTLLRVIAARYCLLRDIFRYAAFAADCLLSFRFRFFTPPPLLRFHAAPIEATPFAPLPCRCHAFAAAAFSFRCLITLRFLRFAPYFRHCR